MTENVVFKPTGLYTSPNSYSESPPGSLEVATNVVFDRKSIVDVRRGNALYSTDVTDVLKLFKYGNTLIANYDTDKLAYDDGTGAFTAYSGTFQQPDPLYKMRSVLGNKNFYFTTTKGVYKLQSYNDTPKQAGISPGLDVQTTAVTSASGFLANNDGVAYRVIWGIKDQNNNLILGAPSMRSIVYATSGTSYVNVTFTIPDDITTDYFYQVYRSWNVTGTSVEPSDELYLVYEGNPTSGELTTGTVTVQDITPFDLMGANLYTNATQEGASKANYQPPFCKDIDSYKNHVFFANTKSKQNVTITLNLIGSPNGLQNGDTITIGGITFTGAATEVIASNQFQIFTSGTLAQNINDTALSLVRVINRSTTSTVYAYYLSGFNDKPGRIMLEEKTIGNPAFVVTSTRGGAFTPTIPASGTTFTSSADVKPNGLFFSKPSQPESVPVVNYLNIGAADIPIDRIVALRDSMFIFKSDGIYRLAGDDSSNFSVTMFDATAVLLARESAVAVNNSVYGWFTQGIASVSDGGVAILSEPIFRTTLELSSSKYPNFPYVTFGISYEADRKYIVYTNTSVNDTEGTQAFVYNYQTMAWSRWDNHRSCGLIGPDGHLFCANDVGVYKERKTFTPDDYADESFDITITAVNGAVATVADATNCIVGRTIRQNNAFSTIVNVDGDDVTVAQTINWTLGTAQVYQPIQVSIRFNPMICGTAAQMKRFEEIIYDFQNGFFASINGIFTSDSCYTDQVTPIIGSYFSGWGQFPYGEVPWGISTSNIRPFRTYVPYEAATCHHLNVAMEWAECFVNPQIMGFTLTYNNISTHYQD